MRINQSDPIYKKIQQIGEVMTTITINEKESKQQHMAQINWKRKEKGKADKEDLKESEFLSVYTRQIIYIKIVITNGEKKKVKHDILQSLKSIKGIIDSSDNIYIITHKKKKCMKELKRKLPLRGDIIYN